MCATVEPGKSVPAGQAGGPAAAAGVSVAVPAESEGTLKAEPSFLLVGRRGWGKGEHVLGLQLVR